MGVKHQNDFHQYYKLKYARKWQSFILRKKSKLISVKPEAPYLRKGCTFKVPIHLAACITNLLGFLTQTTDAETTTLVLV
jgi:hypothetical protein